MRSLYVLRHAKSDWDASYGVDFDRPLSERGVRAADLIGRFLASIDEAPDHVIASTAERARRTVELAVEAGDWTSPVLLEPPWPRWSGAMVRPSSERAGMCSRQSSREPVKPWTSTKGREPAPASSYSIRIPL